MNLKVALLAASASILPYTALAQTGPGALPPAATASTPANAQAQATTLAPVIVTARKRSEQLLNVPISITVLTGKQLQKRQVHSIEDLANQTPGLTVDSTVTSSARNDRSFPLFVIRGMVPSLTTNPTTTLFLDGAPLIGGEVDDLENLEQVEVLKGPQTAYFGRETFGGAISLKTRDPADVPTITLDGLAGDRSYYDERGTIEGPLVPDKLWILGSFRYYNRDGSYNNNAVGGKTSQKLGAQSTKSGNLEIVLDPTVDLKIKLLGLYWHDDDGPSAQALILPSQSNCQAAPTAASGPGGTVPWFCGQVPDRLASQPAANDVNTPAVERFLSYLGTSASGIAFKPLNKGYGLVRDAYHGSATVDYYLENSGITLTAQTSADLQKFSELQSFYNDDGSQEPEPFYNIGDPFADPYNDDPFFVEQQYRSLSQEFRFTSDSDQRFRYLGGLNYEYTRVDASIAGSSYASPVAPYGGFFVGDSPDTSKTISGFGGIEYDIFHNLTLSLDARYQSDQESTSPSGGSQTISATFNDFLPRISLQYKITPQIMVYGTYSDGINPGTFNGDIVSLPAAERQILTKDFGAGVVVKPEKLTNYEAGLKGSFLNDTMTLSADAYYDIWYDQIFVDNLSYFDNGQLKNTSADVNNGKTDLPGVEADMDWLPIPQLEINAGGAINDSSIDHGSCFTCLEETGSENVDHKKLPDVSEFQATVGAEYTARMNFLAGTALDGLSKWDAYGRGDYTFKSSAYENSDDILYTPPENLLNLRAGITKGNLTIEVFVDNVTNWGGPTALSGIGDYGNPTDFTYYNANTPNDSLVAGLPDLRTFGVRLHYKFSL